MKLKFKVKKLTDKEGVEMLEKDREILFGAEIFKIYDEFYILVLPNREIWKSYSYCALLQKAKNIFNNEKERYL